MGGGEARQWRRLPTCARQLCLVIGEDGRLEPAQVGTVIGKSTLLRNLRTEALRRGYVVGWDRCPESASGAPYRSWGCAVEALMPEGSIHQAFTHGWGVLRLLHRLVRPSYDRLVARTLGPTPVATAPA